MQRKTLNIFLYRDHSVENQLSCKIRLIEIQDLENCAEELDQTVIGIYTGIEEPFAVCLSQELDKYKDSTDMPLINGLFKRLRDTYTREVIRDKANAATFLYQDLDMILLGSASEDDMYCLLGAIDNAVNTFKSNAKTDGYSVSVSFSTSPVDFNDKINIIRHAFSSSTDVFHSISRQTAEWIVNEVRSSLPEIQLNFSNLDVIDTAGHLNRMLLSTNIDSLGSTILNDWYLKKQPAASEKLNPGKHAFFPTTIGASIRPLMDSDDLLSNVKNRM